MYTHTLCEWVVKKDSAILSVLKTTIPILSADDPGPPAPKADAAKKAQQAAKKAQEVAAKARAESALLFPV